MATSGTASTPHPSTESTVKETITSIVIAFVVAFVFRGFVLEPFLIPTGSMAPTLMGAHMRFTGPDTAYSWAVGPWSMVDSQTPERVQRDPAGGPVVVHDPMSREELREPGVLSRAGDRIFVLKSLYNVFDPRRYEVIVFKNPSNPQENYIKRLVGLPGEQLAIVDGDIFARKIAELPPSAPRGGAESWGDEGWRIARKPERVQHSVWQPVFDSRYTPLTSLGGGSSSFHSPWQGGKGWEIDGKQIYAFTGSGRTSLAWDPAWAINDFCPYNETSPRNRQRAFFPVSDVRVGLAIKPGAAGQSVAFDLRARRQEFRAEISGTRAVLMMRPAPPTGEADGAWTTVDEKTLAHEIPAGEFTDIEFWHADQTLSLYVRGERVAYAEYNWTPAHRLESTLGFGVSEAVSGKPEQAPVATPAAYQPPALRIDFDGGSFDVARVSVARDLFYQPSGGSPFQIAFGATPERMPELTPDQFFVCGDNSPASLDARLWDRVDPWIKAQVDPTIGVVNRDLLVGRAFFVYFPAPVPVKGLWMPDFGRLRFIW